MTVLGRSSCEDCGRIRYERGGVLVIEAARMANGAAPADAFLEELIRKKEDFGRIADVLIRFEEFARTGTLDVPLQLNSLGNDIWEIKAVDVRLPFYYANSHSRCRAVRLTNGFFKKNGRECPPRYKKRLAMRVRGEDELL